jgi:hypothetical protein
MFCRSLFVLLAIVLPVLLRFTASDDLFGIFKLFLVFTQYLDLTFYSCIRSIYICFSNSMSGRRGRYRIVVGFTTTYAISAYHHWCFSIRARCTTLCDKVCQWLATGWWFSSGLPVSSTNKTDRHDITEILLKVALNTINQANKQ